MQKNRNNFLIDEKQRQTGKQKNRVYYPFLVGNENEATQLELIIAYAIAQVLCFTLFIVFSVTP